MGLGERRRSISKTAFVSALQRLLPKISSDDLVVGRAGVRAQAVAADGSLVDDFLIQRNGPLINVLDAPPPAATSALNIGDMIVANWRPCWMDRHCSPGISGSLLSCFIQRRSQPGEREWRIFESRGDDEAVVRAIAAGAWRACRPTRPAR
jgi:hypothetical protein